MNEYQKETLIDKYVSKIAEYADADRELGHKKIDEILCELLDQLGFHRVVTEYEKIQKWYS